MCTIFGKCINERLIIGRNFDWVQFGGKIYFSHSYRSYGMNTIGCCYIEQMGKDTAYEGFNQNGLFAGVIALPTIKEEDRKLNPMTIHSLGMVKYILERASDVQESMSIVKNFAIDYRIKYGLPKVQYFFADNKANVGIYEEGVYEEIVKLNNGEYRLLTNQSVISKLGCSRYEKINGILNRDEKIDENLCFDILDKAKQEKLTAWTSVYNLYDLEFTLCLEQNFSTKYRINLNNNLKKGAHSIDFAELKLNTRVINRKRNELYRKLDI
ncbi:MAG: hypothetical protein PHY91_02915 [Tissierellia bacterium]|nr:hypothetical protein [Tissierellia bacterium]MDD4726644.1 hypothetical protein [Tissierellia bacterium]